MKIGLLFAGQGAQYTGMGKDLYESSAAAKNVFDQAGEEIKDWCFNGTKEMLRQTHITQPSIYTVSMAAYAALKEQIEGLLMQDKEQASRREQLQIAGMAGFSLGEYTALTASGVIDSYEKGIDIVKQRGQWMNEAGLDENGENKGGMIAAFGTREHILECVQQVRENDILEGVNFNSPQQTVVAGDKEALARFRKAAKAEGIKAVPLSVSTAFHSPMMEPAVGRLRELLENSNLQQPAVKLYSNVTGNDLMEGAETVSAADQSKWIADRMAKQAMSPVYWQEIIENMVADGINIMVEIGPGTTLCGLVKKTNHEVITLNVADNESLAHTVAELKRLLEEA